MKWLFQLVLIFFVTYALFVLLVSLFQRKLIYYPERENEPSLQSKATLLGLKPWFDRDKTRIGWHLPCEKKPSALVLIFGGNAGHALHRFGLAKLLANSEKFFLDVYILEYPGYGSRPGSPSERSLTQAALRAAKLLQEANPSLPLLLVGESLGSGVACAIATKLNPQPQGLLLITPFDSLISAAKVHYPYLPVSLLLQDQYRSDESLQSYSSKVAILIAGNDTITPPVLGKKLAQAPSGIVLLEEIPNANHNNIYSFLNPHKLDKILSFLLNKKDK